MDPSQLDDADYEASVTSSLVSSLAASAGVASTSVTINSFTAGSVSASTSVVWTSAEIDGGGSPDTYVTTASSSPSDFFSDDTLLSAFTVTASNIMSSGDLTVETLQYPSPPPHSPPPPPGCDMDPFPCFPGTACLEDPALGYAYVCGECPAGFTGDGIACADVDECAAATMLCDPLTDCINHIGGFNCTTCPAGYTGSGLSGCVDVDECAVQPGPCDPLAGCANTQGGYSCGACPEGYKGSGDAGCIDADECASQNGGCDFLTECINLAGGSACGDCPEGYGGSGESGCVDVDECSSWEAVGGPCSSDPLVVCTNTIPGEVGGGRAGNGGCDVLTECANTEGGYFCTVCPEGYRSSGDPVRCLKDSPCYVDNGGCDELVECINLAEGGSTCGGCPAGYSGSGEAGCSDEDGCVAVEGATSGGCYDPEGCVDVPAPGVGFTCTACPVGYSGDGVTCEVNTCFNGNGGCDPKVGCILDSTAPSGRLCGGCPEGYADEYLDGTSCLDDDGCAASPCFPGVACKDAAAPEVGYSCGSCPRGYTGDGVECVDVDECAASDNGGCWALDAETRTDCVNHVADTQTPAGLECTACPDGFKGSGESGCFPSTTCGDNNGGCWAGTGEWEGLASTCVDTELGPACGECPEGFDGSGDTRCYDTDGCAGDPCFPEVPCQDVPAPGAGHTCDGCPEGYRGDGETCVLCAMLVSVDQGSIVNGKVTRSGWQDAERVLVLGSLAGLDSEECINTLGTSFRWHAAASDGSLVSLDPATTNSDTLRLSIPKVELRVGLSYRLELEAWLAGNAQVAARAEQTMFVESQPLAVGIQGGSAKVGTDPAALLDASSTVDPDGEPGDISF
eukprot:gene27974-biopygen29028